MSRRRSGPTRVLAIASGGGHWVQLMQLTAAFDGCDLAFVTVDPSYRADVGSSRFYVVPDASMWTKVRLVRTAVRLLWVVARERPDVVVSTGAAPGFLGIVLGRLFGARTVWIDSVANADELSGSGRRAKRHADLWLTQWPHLAGPEGPEYRGSVL